MGGVKVSQLTVEATSPMSSSRIPALERQSLVEVFADVPDPRGRRGRRYRLGVILALAAAAVLAGCRSLLAIWEHIVDLGAEQRRLLGLEPGQAVPFESTIRRVLAGVDADVLDARIGSWLHTRTGVVAGRRVIAVDGKTLRGARRGGGLAPHLLAMLGHASGVVVGQRRVDAKSNEIPELWALLAPYDLREVVVAVDALHTQTGTAVWLRDQGAHYLMMVKRNQPGLLKALKTLPWKNIPPLAWSDRGHG